MKKLFYYEAAYGEEWWAEKVEDMPYGVDNELLVTNFTGKNFTLGDVELPSDGTIDDIVEAYQDHVSGVVNFFWKLDADEADLWIVPDEYLYLFKGTKFNVVGAKGNKLPMDLCIQDHDCSWGERVKLPKTEFFTADVAESKEDTDLPWLK